MSTEMVVDGTPKTALMSRASNRNQSRIEEAERELEELEKASQKTEEAPEDEGKVKEEETPPSQEALSAEEKTFKKRYGDLRKYQQAQEAKLQKEIDDLKARMDKAQATSLPKTQEEVEAWVKKYPDVAAIVESIADKRASERTTTLDARLKEIEHKDQELTLRQAEARLREAHPDFDKIRESDEFHDWAEKQPKWVQDALYEDQDVEATSAAIRLYKADKGIKPKNPAKEAASHVKAQNRAVPQDDERASWFSESKVSKMSDREFAEKHDEIMKATREGKFIYDMSGGAR